MVRWLGVLLTGRLGKGGPAIHTLVAAANYSAPSDILPLLLLPGTPLLVFPVLVFLFRKALNKYYSWRIARDDKTLRALRKKMVRKSRGSRVSV